jgi:hypothetical protein
MAYSVIVGVITFIGVLAFEFALRVESPYAFLFYSTIAAAAIAIVVSSFT